MRQQIARIYHFLGSGALAIGLIAVFAAVLTAATFYESRNGTPAAGAVFYHTYWFAALLVLIGINVTVAALRRLPWQPKHVGFLITHLALDLLLVGSLLTVISGVDGSMTLEEGSSADRVALSSNVLRNGNTSVPAAAGSKLILPGGAVVTVDRVLHTAQPKLDVQANGTQPNPAVHFSLSVGGNGSDGWLVASNPELANRTLGPLNVSLTQAASVPTESLEPGIHLELGKVSFVLPITTRIGLDQPIPGTPFKVRIVGLFKNASVDGNKLVDSPRAPANPAARLELTGPKGTEVHTAFANFPEFPTYKGHGESPSGVVVRYEAGGKSKPALAFFYLPDGRVRLRMGGKVVDVKVNEAITAPWMGMQVTVDQIVPKAVVGSAFEEAEQGIPAVQVSSGTEKSWIALGERGKISGGEVYFESEFIKMPFSVKLGKFIMTTNPGTRTPASFASDVEVTDGSEKLDHHIQMNEPLHYGGYTFFQSGYQEGANGGPDISVLQVSRDPGMGLKYAGTALLTLGIMWLFYLEPVLARKRREVKAAAPAGAGPVRVPRRATTTAVIGFAVLLALAAQPALAFPPAGGGDDPHGGGMPGTGAPSGHGGMPGMGAPSGHGGGHGHGAGMPDMSTPVDPAAAAPRAVDVSAVRRIGVQFSGRVRPLDTFASEVVTTVTGRASFEGRDPVELVLSWVTAPEAWSQRDVIYVPNKQLKAAIGLDAEQSRFSLADLGANQKLQEMAMNAQKDEKKASALDREAATILERVAVLDGMLSGRLLSIVPTGTDPNTPWLSLADAQGMDRDAQGAVTELLQAYVDADTAKLNAAAASFEAKMRTKAGAAYPSLDSFELELFYNRVRPFRTAWQLYVAGLVLFGLGSLWPGLRWPAAALGIGGLLVQTAGFALRCFISGRAPVTNMYESVMYVAWGAALIGGVLAWRYRSAGSAVAAGIVASLLLVLADAMPAALDPSIQPLAPVLRNNFWLTIHVLTITLGYAAFALGAGLGHAWLVIDRFKGATARRCEIGKFLNATLRIGTLLLAAGTLLGGVWASYSWGRFWGWDPKEVWALIALLGYLIVLHGQYAGWFAARGTAIGSIVAFLGVLMAWYGVNYVLGTGLHSYGFGNGGVQYAAIFAGVELLFIAAMSGGKARPKHSCEC